MITRPAIFASAFSPHVGGVEELVRQLATEQLRMGMSPAVFTNRYPKSLPAQESFQGVPVFRHVFRVPEPTVRQSLGWAAHAGATRRSVAAQLLGRDTDLIHVQCVSSNGRYALGAARGLRLPLVVSLQGELTMDASGVYARSTQLRRTWRRALAEAAVVTGCSRYVLDEAQEHLGKPLGDAVRVIPNGIRLAEYTGDLPAGSRRPYVLGIGRMVPQKGFDLLLEAFAQLNSTLTDMRLVLAGDGPCRADLEGQAGRLGVRDLVRFTGGIAHHHAVALMQGAAAFVLGSRHEPQGIVVLEAMAARTAVVAARVGGVPEMVRHGENGLMFEGGSVIGLLEQLSAVLDDDSLRDRLVLGGRATAEEHDWAKIAACYGDAYALASS